MDTNFAEKIYLLAVNLSSKKQLCTIQCYVRLDRKQTRLLSQLYYNDITPDLE